MPDLLSERRSCPACRGADQTELLSLNSEEIIRGNWSYKRQVFADAGYDERVRFPIVKCASCSFIFAQYCPPPEFLSFVYDELIDLNAARREAFSAQVMASRMESVAILLNLVSAPAKVLDYGCGFGATLQLLRGVSGIETIGYEISAARVLELRESGATITTSLAELEVLAPFDAVVLDNVLEHVPDPVATLGTLRELGREGTVLWVSVPDAGERYFGEQLVRRQENGVLAMDINPWEHLNYFDVGHLDAMLATVGFIAIKQVELPGIVNIGLRPERRMVARVRNVLASVARCGRYLASGDAVKSANRRFYRLSKSRAG